MDPNASKRLRTTWALVFAYAFLVSAGLVVRSGQRPYLILSLVLVLVVMFVASYLWGNYDLEVGPTYGMSWRTEVVFVSCGLLYVVVQHYLFHWLVPFHLRFWIAFFLYLNVISPLLDLAVGRLYQIPTLCVTPGLTEEDERTFADWGYICKETISEDKLAAWLQANSDERNRPRGCEVVLLDLRHTNGAADALALSKQYFVRFAGVRATDLRSYLLGRHCRRISFMPMSGLNHRIKRIVDLVISLLMLIVLSPFLLFVALAIKLDSPGPVLFRHRRLGKDLRYFYLLKFRTMYRDAEHRLKEILERDPERRREFESTFKLKNDPRITKVGKFLRKTSLDEIPQLFNIIRDQMSWVGPRPIVAGEIPFYRQCGLLPFRVLPGATGLWQISGRNETSYEERVKLDLEYVTNWSYWRDLKILAGTIPAVLTRRGAY
jgi:lipopolysaccharide/colanic/teichoic acid biosynthesis glycosyltransferase